MHERYIDLLWLFDDRNGDPAKKIDEGPQRDQGNVKPNNDPSRPVVVAGAIIPGKENAQRA